MTDIAVQCAGVSKSFKQVIAVDHLDLAVRRGEILALLGPSGCGKTTTLRLIAGFDAPDAGTVEIAGLRVAGPGVSLPPEQRRVGMVFQNYALFPHLTVAENVAYGLPRGNGKAERLADVLALVELNGYEARLPHELSGGQQQRLALARALAPRPDVLMLDEPFSNLDAGQRARVRREVRDIIKRVGATAIFVTHDQEEAMQMGDRLAIMRTGHLEQVDTPEKVFHHPATRFVAQFLGIADFLPGEIVPGGIQTELGLFEQATPGGIGRRVDVMVRPHDLRLYPDPHSPGVVIERQFGGAEYMCQVQLPSGLVIHGTLPHVLNLPVGTRVRVAAETEHPLVCFHGERAMGSAADTMIGPHAPEPGLGERNPWAPAPQASDRSR